MSQEAQQAPYDTLLDSRAIQQIITKAEEKGLPGVPSGFIDLDRVTNCWKGSTLTVVAGPPSMGCTSLLLAFLRNAVVEFKRTTALFSLQLSREQLLTKWLSAETEIPYGKIESGNLHDHEWLKLNTSTTLWTSHAEAFIRVLDDANPTIEKVMDDCRRLREEGVSLFLIDNLSRITLGKESRAFSTYNMAELIVAKNAFGRTETVQVEFKSACGRFGNQERPHFGESDFDDEGGFAPNTIRLGSRLNTSSPGKKEPQPFPRSTFDGPPPF